MESKKEKQIFTPYQRTHYSLRDESCHYVLKAEMGYLLHPQVQLEGQNVKVADIGAGTGVWAIDLARNKAPAISVDCIELTSEYLPPAEWLPDGVKIVIHDALKEFPESYHGQYDLVHLRWFVTMTAVQVQMLLHNVAALLRPGGYIQWIEHDKSATTLAQSARDSPSKATKAYIDLVRDPFLDFSAKWLASIPEHLESEGLELVTTDRIVSSDNLLCQWSKVQSLALDDVPPGVSSKIDEFKEQYRDDLTAEFLNGVAARYEFLCMVARKVG